MNKEEFIELGNVVIKERERLEAVRIKLEECGLFDSESYIPLLNMDLIEHLVNYLDKGIGYEWFSHWILECKCKEGKVGFNGKEYILTSLSELWDFAQLGNDNE